MMDPLHCNVRLSVDQTVPRLSDRDAKRFKATTQRYALMEMGALPTAF